MTAHLDIRLPHLLTIYNIVTRYINLYVPSNKFLFFAYGQPFSTDVKGFLESLKRFRCTPPSTTANKLCLDVPKTEQPSLQSPLLM